MFSFQKGLNWVVSVVDVGSFAGMVTGLLAGIYGQSRIYFVSWPQRKGLQGGAPYEDGL